MEKQSNGGISVVISKAGAAAMSVLLAATVAWVAPVAAVNGGAPRIAPPVSNAYGKTFPEWLATYYRWYYGTGQDLSQSVVGRVQLLPLPAGEQVGGSGTSDDPAILVGELEITLRPGTPFVLPLVGLVGERYAAYTGFPDDDPAFLIPLTSMSAHLTIDGKTVVSDANQAAFTAPVTYFDPLVAYPEPTGYGSVAAVWFTAIGIVSPPLSAGVHVIHLDSALIVEGIFGVSYDNTWTVTVAQH